MGHRILAGRRGWIGSALLLGTLLTTGVALAFWKISALKASEAAAASPGRRPKAWEMRPIVTAASAEPSVKSALGRPARSVETSMS